LLLLIVSSPQNSLCEVPHRLPQPGPACHYVRETLKTSTVHTNSIHFRPPSRHPRQRGGNANFCTPLRHDDLLLILSLNVNFGRVWLEVRLNKEMSPPKGGLRLNVLAAGMEMLGLGTDQLIGWGYIDLTPLLLGTWEEVWENDSEQRKDCGDGHQL
jgi:hypothetical protein